MNVSNLNFALAEKVRDEYDTEDVTYSDLAKKYDVSAGTIGRIIRGEAYTEPSTAALCTKFKAIKDDFETYGYLEQEDLAWVMATLEKLLECE